MAMRDYANPRRNYANSRAAGAALKRLLKQVSGDGQVTATLVLPLTGHMIELRTFIRRTLRHFFRNFGRGTEVTGKRHGVEWLHLRGRNRVHFLHGFAVWQIDRVTLAG